MRFRYHPDGAGGEALDALNEAIRQALLEEGRFYIVKTNLRGSAYLRVTLSNPFTAEADIRELLAAIESLTSSQTAKQL